MKEDYTGPLPITEETKSRREATIARIRKELEDKKIIHSKKAPRVVVDNFGRASIPSYQ